MLVRESRGVRRLVGRLERGDRLPEALRRLAAQHRVRAGWVSALGAFEWVELVEFDQTAQQYRPPRRVDGASEILSLVGNVSSRDGEPFVHLHATVSQERDERIEVRGGHVLDGAVFACELMVECYDDLTLERSHDPATGLALWSVSMAVAAPGAVFSGARGSAPPAPPVASPEPARRGGSGAGPPGVSWGEVARASAVLDRHVHARSARPTERLRLGADPRAAAPRAAAPLPERRRMSEEEFFEEPIPEAGDFVEHQQFGLCRVDGEDPEGGVVLRLPSGVRKTIHLGLLRVLPPRIEDGRRVFPLERRPKK